MYLIKLLRILVITKYKLFVREQLLISDINAIAMKFIHFFAFNFSNKNYRNGFRFSGHFQQNIRKVIFVESSAFYSTLIHTSLAMNRQKPFITIS